jgi:hypothetical protein
VQFEMRWWWSVFPAAPWDGEFLAGLAANLPCTTAA